MSGKSTSSTYADSDTVPPVHGSRTMVICFDGTGNEINEAYTNVAQFFSMLKKDDCTQQMVYYQTGIGTYNYGSRLSGMISSNVAQTLDQMFAYGISAHVKDGYQFLMENYRPADRICIFGFSRGAYTARALAGMLHKVGLLPPSNIRHIKYAFDTFIQTDEVGWKKANEFKRCFSIDVPIEFVGIWDSVGSLGMIMPGLPFTTSNTVIKTFRHALSLDERRAKFQTNVWILYPQEREKRKTQTGSNREIELSNKYDSKVQGTDVKEVWFAGCHSDVGGGSVPNGTRYSLSRISLRWMVRECFKAQTGILFSAQFLKGLGLDPARLYPVVCELPPRLSAAGRTVRPRGDIGPLGAWDKEGHPSESEEELNDALSPAHDELSRWPLWWLLEIVPRVRRHKSGDTDVIVKTRRPNLGNARVVAEHKGISIHRSVQVRMEAQYESSRLFRGAEPRFKNYRPRPNIKPGYKVIDEPSKDELSKQR